MADDMLETMYEAPGIGLAAVQIGELRRMFVMDLADKESPPAPRVFINPEVLWASEERSVYEEGCLSIPDIYDGVERPTRVRVRFSDRDGNSVEEEADGLYATCFQHELDHLDGVLFVDRSDPRTLTTWAEFERFHQDAFVERARRLVERVGS